MILQKNECRKDQDIKGVTLEPLQGIGMEVGSECAGHLSKPACPLALLLVGAEEGDLVVRVSALVRALVIVELPAAGRAARSGADGVGPPGLRACGRNGPRCA